MEKRSYSVEWLSESSQSKPVYSNMDLLLYRSGHQDQINREIQTSLPSRSAESRPTMSSQDLPEKGNYSLRNVLGEENRLYFKEQNHLLPASHEKDTSSKDFKEVPVCTQIGAPNGKCTIIPDCDNRTRSVSDDQSISRVRTKYSAEQLKELEKSFKGNRYIGSSEKQHLSKVLKLSENQIKTWFQNRRMKFKRQSQNARVEAFFSGLYVPYRGYPDLQIPRCSMQPQFPVLAPPPITAGTIPFGSIHPNTIAPGLQPLTVPFTDPSALACPSLIGHPVLKDPGQLKYNPY